MNKIFILLILLISMKNIGAQEMMGLHTSNWAGVYSLGFNPAEIGDNKYKFHMNLIGLNSKFSNNFLSIDSLPYLIENSATEFTGSKYQNHFSLSKNGNDKEVYQFNKINMPLSFMWNINKKHSVAFAYNLNSLLNVDGLSENFTRYLYDSKDTSKHILSNNSNFNLNYMLYADFGVTYSRTLIDKGNHHLRAAATLKYNVGLTNIHLYAEDLEIDIKNSTMFKTLNGKVSSGSTYLPGIDNVNASNATASSEIDSVKKYFRGGAFGGDIGFVYEFRENQEKYTYTMDCKEHTRYDLPKYKYKLGVSLMDIGYVKFTRTDNNPYSGMTADRNTTKDLDLNKFSAINKGLVALEDTLAKYNLNLIRAESNTYTMFTPTRINIYFDYKFFPWLYLNFTASIAPWLRNSNATAHHVTEFSITPRIEFKHFGFYFPLSTNKSGFNKFGTSMRLGPLFVGTNDITPLLLNREVYGFDVFAGLSVPIWNKGKLKDRDKDGVSNKKDKCKKEQGTCAMNGCPEPDTDKDGVIDREDECKDIAGTKEMKGCPDKDGDKVIDSKDKCPDIAGLLSMGGCPDKDGDMITDADDKCPDLVGLKEFAGCPDTDKDGIQDSDDACPTEAGVKSGNGCPDQDGDGTVDKIDKCVDIAGPSENIGCPYGDTDKDGLNDNDDDCPKLAGPADNKGCPRQEVKVIVEEKKVDPIQKVADLAVENLNFETSKDIINPSSFESLDKLIVSLKALKGYKLVLSGYTDNAGSSANNLSLSKKRTKAVRNYIISKGINAADISGEGYGDASPIGDNATEEGRAKNRRVEIKVNFAN
jgi:outer membrane protein OmpA-like peptidoglycan-associated protein